MELDRSLQLKDIYVFEQALRDSVESVKKVRRRYRNILIFLLIFLGVWNTVTIWSALIHPTLIQQNNLFVYTPIILGGLACIWIWIQYQYKAEDAQVHVARCNQVLRIFNTYFCLDRGKLFILNPAQSTQPSNPNPPPSPHPLPPIPEISNRIWQNVTGARGGLLSGVGDISPVAVSTTSKMSAQSHSYFRGRHIR